MPLIYAASQGHQRPTRYDVAPEIAERFAVSGIFPVFADGSSEDEFQPGEVFYVNNQPFVILRLLDPVEAIRRYHAALPDWYTSLPWSPPPNRWFEVSTD